MTDALGSTGLLALFPGQAEAIEPEVVAARTDATCRGKPALNNKRCRTDLCGGSNCVCAETRSGYKRCVQLRDLRCPEQDRCDGDNDCDRGKVCIKIGACCGHPRRNVCVDLCGN
jgi:hypothetical protein